MCLTSRRTCIRVKHCISLKTKKGLNAFGYHTVVSAPGYTTYYTWFLAGEHRIQAVAGDVALDWVGRTVPMLRELEH